MEAEIRWHAAAAKTEERWLRYCSVALWMQFLLTYPDGPPMMPRCLLSKTWGHIACMFDGVGSVESNNNSVLCSMTCIAHQTWKQQKEVSHQLDKTSVCVRVMQCHFVCLASSSHAWGRPRVSSGFHGTDAPSMQVAESFASRVALVFTAS